MSSAVAQVSRSLDVSVAIPTLDGAYELERTLAAVRAQTVASEIVVLDSSSRDDTRAVARRYGAQVHLVARAWFGHGRARNRLMELTRGAAVAFLTQDAVPADSRWLERLLAPLADDEVAVAYGPYVAPAEAPAWLRREYAGFFPAEARVWGDLDVGAGPGWPAFLSSANLCLRRTAWQHTPFRDVAYAEDQLLSRDLLAAGWKKAYAPGAGVLHAHVYPPSGQLRRYFDEFRALNELYGLLAPAAPRVLAGTVRAELRRDRPWVRRDRELWACAAHHAARGLGAALGTRAGALPSPLRRRLSAEGRP